MPHAVTLDGLTIDDTKHPADYTGPTLFTTAAADPPDAPRPHPYAPCHAVTIRDLRIASGHPLRLSADPAIRPTVDAPPGTMAAE
jgi:hypothetical protein